MRCVCAALNELLTSAGAVAQQRGAGHRAGVHACAALGEGGAPQGCQSHHRWQRASASGHLHCYRHRRGALPHRLGISLCIAVFYVPSDLDYLVACEYLKLRRSCGWSRFVQYGAGFSVQVVFDRVNRGKAVYVCGFCCSILSPELCAGTIPLILGH